MAKEKLTFKYRVNGNEATIKFSGFVPGKSGWAPPKEVVKVLKRHGFDIGFEDDEWISMTEPTGHNLEEDLEAIASLTTVQLHSEHIPGKKPVFYAMIGRVGEPAKGARYKTPLDALDRAHKLWNRAGRPVDVMTVSEALEMAIK